MGRSLHGDGRQASHAVRPTRPSWPSQAPPLGAGVDVPGPPRIGFRGTFPWPYTPRSGGGDRRMARHELTSGVPADDPADVVLDARAELGEGATWDVATARLLWVDIF